MVSPRENGISIAEVTLIICAQERHFLCYLQINGNKAAVTKGTDKNNSVNIAALSKGENVLMFTATDGSTNDNKTEKTRY